MAQHEKKLQTLVWEFITSPPKEADRIRRKLSGMAAGAKRRGDYNEYVSYAEVIKRLRVPKRTIRRYL